MRLHGYRAPVSEIDDLLELEHAGWRALCDGTAADHYGGVMSVDAVMVLANGMVLDRDEVVASLADAPAWDTYEIDDVRHLELGPGVVALMYTGTGHRGGTTFVGPMTSIYRTDGGSPRLALYQQTSRA